MCDCLECHDIVNFARDERDNADSFKEIFRDAFFQVKEVFDNFSGSRLYLRDSSFLNWSRFSSLVCMKLRS